MRYALAVDIGASSGRHIVGWMEDGALQTKEVYRFPNGVTEKDGHLYWDVVSLESHVKAGIREALRAFPKIESLSIDTWGVDYVLLKGNDPVFPVYAYRDSRTEKVIPKVHEKVPFSELYRHTGCQFQPFNTIYQLYEEMEAGRLFGVTDFLMMPEYLLYRLSGVKAKEFTNATTTGLINSETLAYDTEIIEKLGLPKELFTALSQPGTVLCEFTVETGEDGADRRSDSAHRTENASLNSSKHVLKAVLCATHDTGSAVEGIPMEGNHPYISSGTWSLLGVKTPKPITDEGSEKANYSNEGGVGYNRYQKNIMGLWLVNELRRELCPDTDFGTITKWAEASAFEGIIDANAPEFLAPESMKTAFDQALGVSGGLSIGDYFRCAYRSLALSYRKAIDELEANTGKQYEKLYIVGGGAKNAFLNRLTEEATGKQVVALPIEATAIGNLKIQLEGMK